MPENNTLQSLQGKIQQIRTSISQSGSVTPMPELIKSTNLIRSNEFLTQVNQKQNELLLAYEEYVTELKKLISASLRAKIASLRKSKSKTKKSIKHKRRKTVSKRKKLKQNRKTRKLSKKRSKKR